MKVPYTEECEGADGCGGSRGSVANSYDEGTLVDCGQLLRSSQFSPDLGACHSQSTVQDHHRRMSIHTCLLGRRPDRGVTTQAHVSMQDFQKRIIFPTGSAQLLMQRLLNTGHAAPVNQVHVQYTKDDQQVTPQRVGDQKGCDPTPPETHVTPPCPLHHTSNRDQLCALDWRDWGARPRVQARERGGLTNQADRC